MKRTPAPQQSATSARINAIRAAAGNPMTRCPTCARPAHDPYRRIVDGQISEGCIDAFHHGRTCAGASTEWHMRPSAAQHRRTELASLKD